MLATTSLRDRVNGNAASHYKIAFVRSHEHGCSLQSGREWPITLAQDYGLRRTPETLDRAQNSNHF